MTYVTKKIYGPMKLGKLVDNICVPVVILDYFLGPPWITAAKSPTTQILMSLSTQVCVRHTYICVYIYI